MKALLIFKMLRSGLTQNHKQSLTRSLFSTGSKSVMKPRNIITYWRTCMVSSEIALTVREQHFQAELNENPPEVRKTCYDNRHLCLQEYHCKQQQTRNITSEPDNSAVEAQPLIIT